MATGVKIPQLPAATGLSASDLLVKDDGTTTQKLPVNKAYASAEQPGLVSTSAQEWAGRKTFKGGVAIGGTAASPQTINFTPSDKTGRMVGQWASFNNGRPVMVFREQSTDGDALLDTYEGYTLPACDLNRTSNGSYSILTTKTPVSIAHGGTGATTAADARAALEVFGRVSGITDVNDNNIMGVAFLNSASVANLPTTSGYYYLLGFGSLQIAISYTASGNTKLWTRAYANSTWNAWKGVALT